MVYMYVFTCSQLSSCCQFQEVQTGSKCLSASQCQVCVRERESEEGVSVKLSGE